MAEFSVLGFVGRWIASSTAPLDFPFRFLYGFKPVNDVPITVAGIRLPDN